ncbi:methyltransferase domain-containing protein [Rhodobacterales bacterium HKCCE3408]|nr:methyltransferase domain-containing protein [Rhodobacterales bacterium HKCCE3408]
MIAAIRAKRAATAARTTLDGTEPGDAELARSVLAACGAISRRMISIRDEIVAACTQAGVAAEPVAGPEDEDALQIHLTAIRIPPASLGAALGAAAQSGFRLPFRPGPGQITAIARYLGQVMLVRDDSQTARVVLQLAGTRSGGPARFRPRVADIAALDLPPVLSGLYPMVRIGRVLRDRLSGRRAATADSDFLGTPEDLIVPILRMLDPGPDDVVFDLGCGDGRVLEAAARQFGCRAVGVESNPGLVADARSRIAALGPELSGRIEIREGFAEDADLTGATIVFLFLPPYLLRQVFPGVVASLPAGARVVVHEQSALDGLPAPDITRVAVSAEGMTVVQIWSR